MATEPAEPPSLWSLARQVRDPDVRRGMARALHTLVQLPLDTTQTRAFNKTNNSKERRTCTATIAGHPVSVNDEGFMTEYDEVERRHRPGAGGQ